MKSLECADCGKSVPAAGSFTVNSAVLCEPCADKKVAEIQASKGKLEVRKGADSTVCAKCRVDFGSLELPAVAGMHVCETCRQSMLDFRYPVWLKTAFAVLLLLLGIALVHGRSYFAAGRAYYQGKKLLDARRPADALPYFESALKSGTAAPEVIEHTALAYLQVAQPEAAARLVKGRSFERDELYSSLQGEFNRWDQTNKKLEEVARFADEKKFKEAASRMRELAAAYPAAPVFSVYLEAMISGDLFYSHDYEAMAQHAQKNWENFPVYESSAMLAGAYACLYATSGNEQIKQKALDAMSKARSLATSKEYKDDLAEFQPRFDYRIESRKIIDKAEYDALFRPELASKKVTR